MRRWSIKGKSIIFVEQATFYRQKILKLENLDIRWKQRFQNFTKALNYLELALNIEKPNIVQKAGIIQFFEKGFELA